MTTIAGGTDKYNNDNIGDYIKPIIPGEVTDSTTEKISTENGTSGTTVISGNIYELQGDSNNTEEIGHGNYNDSRLTVPNSAMFAINLNGTDRYLTKMQINGQPSANESALVAGLSAGSFMTIFNNATTPRTASFAILQDADKNKVQDRRLQNNIEVNS